MLPLAAAVTCIYGITFLAIQQYIRLSANELPMQYASDIKGRLESGVPISNAIKNIDSSDMQKSLSPFVIIYDNNGIVKNATTTLHGKCPAPPPGVFTIAKQDGENRRTWQPEPGVRNAIVVLPYSINGTEGYVIAGRSLREVEMREHFLFMQIALGLFFTMVATFIAAFISQFIKNRVSVLT